MKTIVSILLGIILFNACSHQKEVSYFALEDHTFEESCAHFDSCYRASHPEKFNNDIVIIDTD